MYKRILGMVLAVSICLMSVGCGNEENNDISSNNSSSITTTTTSKINNYVDSRTEEEKAAESQKRLNGKAKECYNYINDFIKSTSGIIQPDTVVYRILKNKGSDAWLDGISEILYDGYDIEFKTTADNKVEYFKVIDTWTTNSPSGIYTLEDYNNESLDSSRQETTNSESKNDSSNTILPYNNKNLTINEALKRIKNCLKCLYEEEFISEQALNIEDKTNDNTLKDYFPGCDKIYSLYCGSVYLGFKRDGNTPYIDYIAAKRVSCVGDTDNHRTSLYIYLYSAFSIVDSSLLNSPVWLSCANVYLSDHANTYLDTAAANNFLYLSSSATADNSETIKTNSGTAKMNDLIMIYPGK